ncbi:isochorismatase family protein [Ktedonosporobacter rubrisoli]|uniref:Isochorismatase family protein n=1 Tax=Ktedonosporobacter rubrisoli TaxID=2509675 RepID=A0A4P6JMS3_KTERU|nr:isochorismatase family protein [Ktedonosporobacter rubrisoli]QBD76443.1 isochorismatase family protein [Ktedonosporobacter rubrisoli]
MSLTELEKDTALVLIDMQKGIAAGPTAPHTSEQVIANSAHLAEAFRARQLPVILVRVTFAADGSDLFVPRADVTPGSVPSAADWDQLVEAVGPAGTDIIVEKRSWNAFHGTALDLHLRRRNITSIVLGGIATSIGVESTARAAHDHGYHLIFASDAMTDRAAKMHDHSVQYLFPRLGRIATTEEVLAALKTL